MKSKVFATVVILAFTSIASANESSCRKLLTESLKYQASKTKAEVMLELDEQKNFLTKSQAIQLTQDKEYASKTLSDLSLLFSLYCEK